MRFISLLSVIAFALLSCTGGDADQRTRELEAQLEPTPTAAIVEPSDASTLVQDTATTLTPSAVATVAPDPDPDPGRRPVSDKHSCPDNDPDFNTYAHTIPDRDTNANADHAPVW